MVKLVNDGGLKARPCPKCMQARRAMQRAIAGVTGKSLPTHFQVRFDTGDILYINFNNQMAEAGTPATEPLRGRKVHVTAGKKLIDLATGKAINDYGNVASVTKITYQPKG